jgi:hypothetical protein
VQNASDTPEIATGSGDLFFFPSGAGNQRRVQIRKGADFLERLGMLAPFEKYSASDGRVSIAGLIMVAQPNQPVCIRIRQRPEQRRTDHAKYCRVQANPQTKRDYNYRRKAWTPAQHSQSITQILQQLLHPNRVPDCTRILFDQRDISELAQRRMASFLRWHAAIDVVLRFHLDMVTDVVVEAIDVPAAFHGLPSSFAGRRIRAMAPASLSHLVVSMVSCLRPLAVNR